MRTTRITTAVLLAAASSLCAQSISVNIGANTGTTESFVDEAGKTTGAILIAGDLWNNTVGPTGTLGGLIDSTGTTTGAEISWFANNRWNSASPGATATSENGDLTQRYLDDSQGWTVNLLSPYLLNDIYIIHATDQGDPATMSAVSVNGTFYKGDGTNTILASGSGDSWSAQNWTAADNLAESANYLKILAQPGVSLEAFAASPGRAAIAGLQVENAYSGTLSYWDVDGSTPGAGGGNDGDLDGTWGTDSYWSTSADGNVATGAWSSGNGAVFSAGTDGLGYNEIAVSGTRELDALWVQEGGITLTGGILDMSSGLGLLRSDGFGLVVDSQVTAANLSTVGDVTLNNASNSVSGLVTIGDGFTTLGTATTWTKIAGSGGLDIFANTLTLGDATDSTFGGTFYGDPGAVIDKVGSGTLTLGNASDGFGGSGTVSAGTLAFSASGNLFWDISGAGSITKTGGGQLNVLSDITTTGALDVDSGTLQVGNVGTGGSIGNPASIAITNDSLLRYRLSGANATLSSPVGFGTVDSNLRQHGGGTDDLLTLSGAVGTDTDTGTLSVGGGDMILASGAVAQVKNVSLFGAPAGDRGTLVIEAGSTLNADWLNLGDGGNQSGIINQTGGTVTMKPGGSGIRIGHWNNGNDTFGSEYNISGGVLDASQADVNCNWHGKGTLTVNGTGLVKALRLDVDEAGAQADRPGIVNLETGGRIEIGDQGIGNDGAPNSVLNLAGGTLAAVASSTWDSRMDAITATSSTIEVGSGSAATMIDPLAGDGTLSKTGAGTLILSSGSNTYTGALSVDGGTLKVNSTLPTTVTVASGGTIGAGTATAVGFGEVDALTLDSGSSSSFRIGAATDEVSVFLADSLTVNSPHSIGVVPVGAVAVNDQFPLFTYSGAIQGSGFAGLGLASFPNPHYSLSLVDNAGSVDLLIDGITPVVWTGASGTAWNLTTANWDDGAASNFYALDLAVFNDLDASESVVVDTLGGTAPIAPAAMTFNNTIASTYTLSGDAVSGQGGLTKTGDGTVIITNDNTFTGLTEVQAGTLQIGDGGSTGSVASNIDITGGALVAFDRNDAFSVTANGGQTISGGGTVTFDGSGTGEMTLAGRNSFTGGLTVDDGTVILSGGGWYQNPSQGTGLMTVNTGSTVVNWNTHSYGSSPEPGWDMILDGGSFQLRSETYVRDVTMIAGTIDDYPGSNSEFRAHSGGVTNIIVEDAATPSVISATYNCVGGSTITVNDPDTDLTFSGVISGAAALNTDGVGTLVSSATNTHTGNLNINAGTFALAATGSHQGSPQISVAAGATFDVTGHVAGYPIPTGQTLAGNGTVSGGINVAGTVAPGASVGALTTGAVTFGPGSVYNWEISDWNGAAGTGYDTMVASSVNFTSTSLDRFTVVINEDALVNFSETDKSFVIASTGGITNFSVLNVVVDPTASTSGAGTWELVVDGTDLVLEYTALSNTYDAWVSANYPGLIGGFEGDPDNDGFTSGEEWYYFNSDPTQPDAHGSPIGTVTSTGVGSYTFEHVRPIDRTGTTENYEWSATLDSWNLSGTPAGGYTVTVTAPATGTPVPGMPGYESVIVGVVASPNDIGNLFARLRLTNP